MKRIYLISGKAQHGKDTFADAAIAKYGGVKLPLAGTLKDIAAQAGWNGEKDTQGRVFLQKLGDLIKDSWGQNWFAVTLTKKIEASDAQNVFVPDVRFVEELEYLRDELSSKGHDVHVVRVERPNWTGGLSQAELCHRSETALDSYRFEKKLVNTQLEDYQKATLKFIEQHLHLD